MTILDDDDVMWERHSGGSGHSGVEWGDDDAERAEYLYSELPSLTRFVFDLMIDRPGERLSSGCIAEQITEEDTLRVKKPASIYTVRNSLQPFGRLHAETGRRMPFYWWRVPGGHTEYAVKADVARVFKQARDKVGH